MVPLLWVLIIVAMVLTLIIWAWLDAIDSKHQRLLDGERRRKEAAAQFGDSIQSGVKDKNTLW